MTLFCHRLITAHKLSLGQGNVCHSVHGSWGGVHGIPACISGHMTTDGLPPVGGSASRGVCLQTVCIQGVGQIPQVCLRVGGCGQSPPPRYMGYYGIRSRSGRYASYWNAFLLRIMFLPQPADHILHCLWFEFDSIGALLLL